jgi:DNA-binding protein Fis
MALCAARRHYPTKSDGELVGRTRRAPSLGRGGEPRRGPATIVLRRSKQNICAAISPLHGDQLPPAGLYDQHVSGKSNIPLILAHAFGYAGNQLRAAELLGLNRNTLRKKIRELGVTVYRSPRPV